MPNKFGICYNSALIIEVYKKVCYKYFEYILFILFLSIVLDLWLVGHYSSLFYLLVFYDCGVLENQNNNNNNNNNKGYANECP